MEARNDEKGLAACYVRQKEALKHYIASRIDRPDEAEDVVQDVFERLWKHKDFISPEAVVSLAYKVARNLMADRQRRYRKENDVWGELFYTPGGLARHDGGKSIFQGIETDVRPFGVCPAGKAAQGVLPVLF